MTILLKVAAVLALLVPRLVHAQQARLADTLAAGTLVPVRFVHGIVSGRDTAGSRVMLQSKASLTRDHCVMLSPFRPEYARLVQIRSDGRAAVLKAGCGALNDLTR